MRVLVLGGAGYIGSHMLRELQRHGDVPMVLDDLSTGHREAVGDCELIEADLLDGPALARVVAEQRPEVVMHFAAKSIVPESLRDPALYYRSNLTGTLNLLDAMRAAGVPALIFSSTAAVYGAPEATPIPETAPLRPVSPYGRSKLFIEQLLTDYAAAYDLKAISLRYFNAVGADAAGDIGEAHEPETHLIPNLLRSAAEPSRALTLYGTEHPTPDGTAIRDYIHVTDLCAAHRLAAERLRTLPAGSHEVFNLGIGHGYSVREVIDTAARVLGRELPYRVAAARPGDPPRLVAAPDRAQQLLGWQCAHSSLENIIETAWRWHQNPRY